MNIYTLLTKIKMIFCVFCLLIISWETNKNISEKNLQTSLKLQLSERPNILWLVTEDMGPYIASFGDNSIQTPNLSRLANEGVRYPNLFSPSGVCAPSRAAIATGMYPTSIGAGHMRTKSHTQLTGLPAYEAVPPAELKMISELLRIHGYYCTNNSKEDYQFKAPVTAWDESSNKAHWRNRKQDQPFFAIFNFNETHESRLFEPYQQTEVIPIDTKFKVPPYLPDNEIVQRDLWKMYNNIALMDQKVGRILDQLEKDGLLENTIVFFYGDHGGPLPRQKRLIYDAGINTPLIIRFPNQQKAGSWDKQLISFIDFAPTLLSLGGITPPKYMQGQPFLNKKQPEDKRTYIHSAVDRLDGITDAIRAVRDKQFKYIRNYRPEQGYYLPIAYREKIPTMKELLRLRNEGKLNETQVQWFRKSKAPEELFDCKVDPHELNNLANNPDYKQKLIELSSEMDRWIKEIGDQPNLPELELISQLWEGVDSKPVTAKPIITSLDGKIHISCSTKGASLGYKIISKDGVKPKAWSIYQKPLIIPKAAIVLVQAHRIGFTPSEIIESEVFIKK
jgi:arylsulfatase A-like enzyme